MKYIFIILVALFVLSCHFSCKTTDKAKHEKVDDGDVLRPPEGYNNNQVQKAEKEKDSLNEFSNRAAAARPQPCIQVTGLQETGKTANTASFSWTSTGVNKYYVYKNVGTAVVYIGTATSTSYTATGLTPNTNHIFRVAGVGKGNKTCPQSAPITIQTLPATEPPSGGGQANVVFLQFEADTISGTSWSSTPIISPGSGLTEDKKLEIFNHFKATYSEHLKIFFTMDKAVFINADANYKHQVTITDNPWYGQVGGVAFVGSFNTGQPSWVFSGLLNYVARNIYLAGEHELGHALGLYHTVTDTICSLQYGLAVVCGDGITRAPIMGGSYTPVDHIFYNPVKGSLYGILWKQRNDCTAKDEDAIIESHLR